MNIITILTSGTVASSGSAPAPGEESKVGWSFFSDLWKQIVDFFLDHGVSIFIRGILAVLLVIGGHYLIKLIIYVFRKLLSKPRSHGRKIEVGVISFFSSFLKFILTLILVFAVFAILNIPLTSLLSVISASVLAIGLALQDMIANFANGVYILASHIIKTGDMIEVDEVSGTVTEFNMLSVVLKTVEGKIIYVPNSIVAKNTVTNFSANPIRRITFTLGVTYNTDLKKCREVILNTINSNQLVLKDPAPSVNLTGLSEFTANMVITCHVNRPDYWATNLDLCEKLFYVLKDSGIQFQPPKMDIRINSDQQIADLIAKHPGVKVKKNDDKE